MKTALFPGTFDPPTLGHFDIIQRAATLCDKLYVGVAVNLRKAPVFSIEEREDMLKLITKGMPHVEVLSFEGLVVDFVVELGVESLIRSFRTSSDLDYEFAMALTNRQIGGVETSFLMAGEGLGHISSTLIKEVAWFGKRLSSFVPGEIEERVFQRLKQTEKQPI
ncbi:MAG: pantetheine-phosphate adenylyltransferase [Chlamydiales bacterium]|jgi:pantetheine-phosphate adenylyltransferase